MFQKQIFPKAVSLTFGVLVLFFAVGFYINAWTEPGSSPPGGNVPAPLNASTTAQSKAGYLNLSNIYLNASGTEGNISAINVLSGYNDIFIKSNDSENASVYIGGSTTTFYTNSTARMTIASNGNIGVGTTSPAYKLDVYGIVNGTQLCINKVCQSSWPSGGGSGYWSSSTPNIYYNLGNVGIGDASPASLLAIGNGDLFQVNSSGDMIKLKNVTYSWPSSQGAASTYLKNDGAGGLTWATVTGGSSQWTTAGSDIYYNYSSTDTVWITRDDNNPDNTVTLRLGNHDSTYKNYSAYIQSVQGNGIDEYSLAFGVGNAAPAAEAMRISKDGKVGIGINAPAQKLDVRGSIRIGSGAPTSGRVLCWTSDNRIGYCGTTITSGACTCTAIP
jgi:trimeric autotransporter adhesin